MPFWNFILQNDDVELRIDGDIVDDGAAWIYEWFGEPATSPNAFRNELKKHEGKNLTIWIDSYGGDIVAAAGIYHALKEFKGKKTVKIDGKAMSAASVIAMAGDEIIMNPMSIMMIHNPWTGVQGEAKDMRHTADVLDTIKDTIINAYQAKTKKSRSKIAELMDNETWMSAKSAVELGFADKITHDDDAGVKNSVENSFMYNRLAFQNSAAEAIKQMLEVRKLKDQKEEPPKDDSGLNSVNLYQTQILINRRKNNV
jgi:ATP-dependent Clp protease protease subunit